MTPNATGRRRTVQLLTTAVALVVTATSFIGLLEAATGSGVSHVVGALFGASLFGYLAYWTVRQTRR